MCLNIKSTEIHDVLCVSILLIFKHINYRMYLFYAMASYLISKLYTINNLVSAATNRKLW